MKLHYSKLSGVQQSKLFSKISFQLDFHQELGPLTGSQLFELIADNPFVLVNIAATDGLTIIPPTFFLLEDGEKLFLIQNWFDFSDEPLYTHKGKNKVLYTFSELLAYDASKELNYSNDEQKVSEKDLAKSWEKFMQALLKDEIEEFQKNNKGCTSRL